MFYNLNFRSDYYPNLRHRHPGLLGSRERRAAVQIQDRSRSVGKPLHHQPSGSRDFMFSLPSRILNRSLEIDFLAIDSFRKHLVSLGLTNHE